MVERLFETISGEYAGFNISLSIGISIFPKDGTEYEQLFQRADQALYEAKKHGRDQYCFYSHLVEGTLSVLSPMDSDAET